ncbi:HD domain-containing protein [Pelosinus propionicus]|uniref:HD domain-containing protein n=1 Tax=Pelosinus propionicus DSM 13327 TaxID=1123291 RepID=A0A1I4IYJ0_9FIRM|nr:HD domain-containing protein [Pelosinus propionicus]SFL59340.1 HD domain-containing protein [Pelosinus propionicus DSM 13327]
MIQQLIKVMPEFNWIKDDTIREATINSYVDALTMSGWCVDDMNKIPFTLLVPVGSVSYLVHVQAVTRMCHMIWDEYQITYKGHDAPVLDYDTLIAGALLHDVGKLVEYKKTTDGKFIKSEMGKELRHPFSGTVIAMRNGIPSNIAHTIANHAKEGDGTLRTPEAVIINKVDVMNFEMIKSFHGII